MKKIFCLCLFINSFVLLFAQNTSVPVLEREISLSQTNQSIQTVLASLSQQGGFVFSYNPEAIGASSRVTVIIQQKSVRHALNIIFNETVSYKVKGRYIILQKKKVDVVSGEQKQIVIEGYVYDGKSGQKVTQTSVYDKNLMVSAITDKYGYFRITLPPGNNKQNIHFSKEGYVDTMVIPLQAKSSYLNIELNALPPDIAKSLPVNDKHSKKLFRVPAWMISQKIIIHTRNFSDFIFKDVQFSFFPNISTNKFLTGKTVNNYSFNLTIGLTQGIKKFEAAGLINIVNESVEFCQVAGIGNIVGKEVKGFQAGGIFNHGQTLSGVQSAGIYNIINDSTKGVQMAGIVNKTDNLTKGAQIAGIGNISNNVTGIQIGGIFNIAKIVNGSQISGIINKTSNISGVQLSVINFADSASGIPIGLFSFVKNGYHKLEMGYDESMFTNLSFRSGVQHFHTIFIAGVRMKDLNNPICSFGFGMGTSFGKNRKFLWDLDLTSQSLLKGDDLSFTNNLYRLYGGIDKSITKKMSLSIGLSFNALLSDKTGQNKTSDYSDIIPSAISSYNFSNGHNLKTWAGMKVAIRFF